MAEKFRGSRSIVFAKLTRFGGSQSFLASVHLGVALVLLAFSIFFLCCSQDEVDPRKVYVANNEQESDEEALDELKD